MLNPQRWGAAGGQWGGHTPNQKEGYMDFKGGGDGDGGDAMLFDVGGDDEDDDEEVQSPKYEKAPSKRDTMCMFACMAQE